MTIEDTLRGIVREEMRVLCEALKVRPSPPEACAAEYLSMKEVTAMTGYSEPTIRKGVKARELKQHGKGRSPKYLASEVRAWMASRPTAALEPDVDDLADAILSKGKR